MVLYTSQHVKAEKRKVQIYRDLQEMQLKTDSHFTIYDTVLVPQTDVVTT